MGTAPNGQGLFRNVRLSKCRACTSDDAKGRTPSHQGIGHSIHHPVATEERGGTVGFSTAGGGVRPDEARGVVCGWKLLLVTKGA